MQILFLFFCYLLGSIPTGVWYSRWKHQIDVRELGSRNSGATNIGRNFGFKAALFVTIVDIIKGLLPMVLAYTFFSSEDWVIMGAGIMAVIGHAYPIFANFKGGKIVATSFGVMAGFHFFTGLTAALLLFAIIYLSSMISFSAMTSYLFFSLYIFFTQPLIFGIGFLLITLFMIYRHRENVQRLIKGEENLISFGLRNSKKQQNHENNRL